MYACVFGVVAIRRPGYGAEAWRPCRLAYRLLKNAGFVPPEIESLKGSKAERKLVLLRARIEARYYDKVIARMGGRGPRARR